MHRAGSNGILTIGVMADPDAVPDMDTFTTALTEALDALTAAAALAEGRARQVA